jgi:hypothetical protein
MSDTLRPPRVDESNEERAVGDRVGRSGGATDPSEEQSTQELKNPGRNIDAITGPSNWIRNIHMERADHDRRLDGRRSGRACRDTRTTRSTRGRVCTEAGGRGSGRPVDQHEWAQHDTEEDHEREHGFDGSQHAST